MGLFDAIFGRKKRREEEERQARERLAEFERMKREEKENEERKAMLQNKRREEVISEAKALGNNGKIYYILDFYLDCSHWREQNAILEKTPLALPVKRVDVYAEDDVVRKYNVSCLPKLILVDIDGNEIHRWKGTTQSEDINNYLYDNGYACRKLDVEKKPSRDISIVERAILRDPAAPKPTNSMNRIIASYIKQTYGLELETATAEDLAKVTEILVSDRTMSQEHGEWDFSIFPNLEKADCSYNPIKVLNICNNHKLEYIRFEGVRGRTLHKLDFSGNPHLKEVRAGQDGVVELDFSSNCELEKLSVVLSNSLRWLNLDNCPKLKSINLHGAIIPFVDLTHCKNLTHVNINYWNLYGQKYNEFGPGYPRPIIFVADDFDESVISESLRQNKYYTYYLIRVNENSIEDKFLQKVKSMKSAILSIPADVYGKGVARMHYDLLEIYETLKSE